MTKTKRNGSWVAFAHRLAAELNAKPEITMTIEAIKEATGTRMTMETLGDRHFWRSCREGKKDFDTQTNAGLALQERIDEHRKVVAVTYRLARLQSATPLAPQPIDARAPSIPRQAAEGHAGILNRDEDLAASRASVGTSPARSQEDRMTMTWRGSRVPRFFSVRRPPARQLPGSSPRPRQRGAPTHLVL